MSYICKRIDDEANSPNLKEYVCDTRADIDTLPTNSKIGKNGDNCCAGSECLCLQDSSVWILGKDSDKWIELGV